MPPFRPPQELSVKLNNETDRLIGNQEIGNQEMPKHAQVIERARNLATTYGEKQPTNLRYYKDAHVTPWYEDPRQQQADRSTVSFQLAHYSGARAEQDITILSMKVSRPHPTNTGELLEFEQRLLHFNQFATFERAGAIRGGNAVCMAENAWHNPRAIDTRSQVFVDLEDTLRLIEQQAQRAQDPAAYID